MVDSGLQCSLNSSRRLNTSLKGFSCYLILYVYLSAEIFKQKVNGMILKAFEYFSSLKLLMFLKSSFFVVISWWCSKWLTICPKLCDRRSKLMCLETGLQRKWKCDCWLFVISVHKYERVSCMTRLTSCALLPLRTWYLNMRPRCVCGRNWF